MRFVELALLAAPFLVFAAWRLMAPNAGPPRALVIGLVLFVAITAILLLVLRREDANAPDSAYVPPRIENGKVLPGHGEPAPR